MNRILQHCNIGIIGLRHLCECRWKVNSHNLNRPPMGKTDRKSGQCSLFGLMRIVSKARKDNGGDKPYRTEDDMYPTRCHAA